MIFLPKITLTRNRFQCSYDNRYVSKTFKTSYDDYNDWNKNYDVEDHDHCHEINIFSCSRGICPRLSRLQPAAFLRQFFHPGLVGVFLFVESFRAVWFYFVNFLSKILWGNFCFYQFMDLPKKLNSLSNSWNWIILVVLGWKVQS